MVEIKAQFGCTHSVDFETKIWEFEMDDEYFVASAGRYAILSEQEYNRLFNMLNKEN